MKRYLLCTDLDRTLIPNGIQPESPMAKERFTRLIECEPMMLAYVSGRHRALIEQAIADFDLPQPDFVIADVGASIYEIESSHWLPSDRWEQQVTRGWNGWTHNEIYQSLSVFPTLRLQEQEKQSTHKLSFYVTLDMDVRNLINEIKIHLQFSGIKANLIWSIDEAAHVGLLDILPATANKLHAICFLMQDYGFSRMNTLFAGDSGNDLDVLLSDEVPSILVANADEDIKERLMNSNPDFLYIAKGDFLKMNGNYRAGILEGIAHYWPEVGKSLREMR